jgi:hypothetical protein
MLTLSIYSVAVGARQTAQEKGPSRGPRQSQI